MSAMIPTRRRRPQQQQQQQQQQGGKPLSMNCKEVPSQSRSSQQQIQKSPKSTGGGPALISLPAPLGNGTFGGINSSNQRQGVRRTHTNTSQTSNSKDTNNNGNSSSSSNASGKGSPNTCWDITGLNFVVAALSIWLLIVLVVWWPELKDNALDYYYLQYPEQQPLSPIPGTVLPLIPNVWFFDPDKANKKQQQNQKESSNSDGGGGGSRGWKKEVHDHLQEYRQPHYYMLPQEYYEQLPPGHEELQQAKNTTAVRGILVYLHPCHQSGLHFFQLPESRRVAAEAMKRGLAIFSPTASAASKLLTTSSAAAAKGEQQATRALNNQKVGTAGGTQLQGLNEKNCWSSSLDGEELLGPLLYEWAREMDMLSLPRMAMAVSNGANLLMASSLYKTLRLQSMALYGSHHPEGFDPNDLELDLIPATAFVVFPKNEKATEYAMQHFTTLQEKQEEDDLEMELRMEEENEEFKKQETEEDDEESSDEKAKAKTRFFRKTQIWKVEPHPWTPSLCQERLPEYHTRCRSFFRHLKAFQDSKRRKQELKQMKQDPLKRIKKLRLAAGGLQNAKQKFQLISSVGEVLQSSKSTQWIPIMEKLGLDDWTTHTMAFSLAWDGNNQLTQKSGNNAKVKKMRKKKSQLKQFPSTATPEGRSWLWASMLQEIEVAYGVQEMTSEHSSQILDFLMYHAGLALPA